MVKKIRIYAYSFWHDPRTWQTDRQTDRRTDRHRMMAGRACIASRGQKWYEKEKTSYVCTVIKLLLVLIYYFENSWFCILWRMLCLCIYAQWRLLCFHYVQMSVPMSRANMDSFTEQACPLHACSSGGIIWPPAVLSWLVSVHFRAPHSLTWRCWLAMVGWLIGRWLAMFLHCG